MLHTLTPATPRSSEGQVVVMVVDDVEAQRYAIGRVLSAAGLRVIEAATGSEALQKVENNPHAIVLDVGLPDMDGFEVCRRIKTDARTTHIPVVFLSATSQSGSSLDLGLRLGAEAYLFQPVDPGTLLTVIRVALARHSLGPSL